MTARVGCLRCTGRQWRFQEICWGRLAETDELDKCAIDTTMGERKDGTHEIRVRSRKFKRIPP